MSSKSKDVDVVIVGAGFSGLAAAHELQQLNGRTSLVVLEAKDRVGGRVFSKMLPAAKGEDRWDMGGQWVSASQIYIMQLLEEFGMGTFKQYSKGKKMMMVNDFTDVRTYSGLYPSLNIFQLLDLDRTVKKIEKMVAQVPPSNPLLCKNASEWDSVTLQSFLDDTVCFKSTAFTIACAMRTVFGAEPLQISLFYFLYTAAVAGGVNRLLDHGPGDAQELRVQDTVYELACKLKKKIGEDNVKCDQPVVSIDQTDPSTCVVTTLDGAEYRARFAIVAIPPHLVNRIRFTPELPVDRMKLCDQMPFGNLIKFVVTYKTAFWKENGESGESSVILPPNVVGNVCVTFDATTVNDNPAIVGFVGGEHAIYWSTKTMDDRKAVVLESLAAMFGPDAESQLIHYEDKDWAKVPYTGGCPVGIMQPGGMMYFHQALRKPFDRVFWAGTECAGKWVGYIDGAVEAGQRAANEVVQAYNNNEEEVPHYPEVSPVFGPPDAIQGDPDKGFSLARFLKGIALCGGVAGVAVLGYRYFAKSNE